MERAPRAADTTDGLSGARLFWAVLAWSLGFTMSNLDGTIANIALPMISQDLRTSPAMAIWVVNAFHIATAVAVLPMSSLADIVGYKRVYQGGLALFTAASLMCALSSSLEWLILGRVLQGAGAGTMVACLSSFMRFNYPAAQLGRGIAINSMIITAAVSAGPAIASAILAVASWPWLFAVNVPICFVALVLTEPMLAQGHAQGHRWDVPSALLNGAAFVLFIVGVQGLGQSDSWLFSAGAIVVAVLGAIVLVRRQLSRPAPMLGVDLLRIPLIAASVVTSLFCFVAHAMAMVVLPFLVFSPAVGASKATAALVLTAWPVGAFLASPVANRLSDRFSVGVVGAAGMLMFGVSLMALAFLPADPSIWQMLWPVGLSGFGFSFFGQTNLRTIVGSAPRERSGAAGGINTSFRLLGQSTGTALVAVAFALFGAGHATPKAIQLILIIAAALSACGVAASLRRTFTPRG